MNQLHERKCAMTSIELITGYKELEMRLDRATELLEDAAYEYRDYGKDAYKIRQVVKEIAHLVELRMEYLSAVNQEIAMRDICWEKVAELEAIRIVNMTHDLLRVQDYNPGSKDAYAAYYEAIIFALKLLGELSKVITRD